ncbi:hypothetical protein P879_03087 [Paragonimus westermani]|uniref:RNA helicase n=1 Tax=Paragonimus westermani TaxID=34504 RepID=A0A8T0DG18_9TREM|nr:hypothetical protein P879_03087 [Paragonimus westermani]
MSYDGDREADGLGRKLASLDVSDDRSNESAAGSQLYVPPHLRNRGMSNGAYGNNQGPRFSRGSGFGGDSYRGRPNRGGFYSRGSNFDRGQNDNRFPGFNDQYSRNSGPAPSFGSRGGGRSWGNDHTEDWSKQLPPNERLEQELFKKVSTGIHFDQYDNIPVSATGPDFNGETAVISSFADLDLNRIIRNNVELAQYERPTPVQKHAIPIIASNRDLMACAQTGSGKTAAFLIPILNRMIEEGPGDSLIATMETNRRKQFPVALILAPTRELASQIFEDARKFAYRSRIRPCVLYGGADMRAQLIEVSKGCNLLVATPGRLTDVIERGRIGLDHCRFLILDEADRMLDMGFEPQIRRIVEQDNLPPSGKRQTLMFSATFPHEIQMLAKDFLSRYIFLAVGRVGSTSENITQSISWVEEDKKRDALVDLLSSSDPGVLTLVFVETKRGADSLEDYLFSQKFQVASIHGDRTQDDRELALSCFRNGRTPILVATAVAARGLDIPNVKHVINYDLPSDIEEYVHRIGRTGRVGNLGIATSFFNDKNRNLARGLVELLEEVNQNVPSWLRALVADNRQTAFQRPRNNRRGGGFGGKDYRQSSTRGGGNSNSGYSGGVSSRFGGGVSRDYGMQRDDTPYYDNTTTVPSGGKDWWGS